MVLALAAGLAQHRPVPSSELVTRAMREFDELPTLRITLDQAMRLLDADRATCTTVLEELIAADVIRRDNAGRYSRLDAD